MDLYNVKTAKQSKSLTVVSTLEVGMRQVVKEYQLYQRVEFLG